VDGPTEFRSCLGALGEPTTGGRRLAIHGLTPSGGPRILTARPKVGRKMTIEAYGKGSGYHLQPCTGGLAGVAGCGRPNGVMPLRVAAVAGGAGSCANRWPRLTPGWLASGGEVYLHAAPRHRAPPRCATCNGLTPSLRPNLTHRDDPLNRAEAFSCQVHSSSKKFWSISRIRKVCFTRTPIP
jgi:hypothetical protein